MVLSDKLFLAADHPEQAARQVAGLLSLGEKYGADALQTAATAALCANVHSYAYVRQWLSSGRTALSRRTGGLPSEKLKRLRLFGMARALEDLQNLTDRGQLDFADQLALLIDREATDRANTALLSRLRQARLRQSACFENLNMKAARGLDKGMIRDLFTCRWIGEHRHLIVTGKTGTGKSWLACALGNQAAREGYSVLYTRLSRLLDDFAVARLGNGVGRLMRQVSQGQRADFGRLGDDRPDRCSAPRPHGDHRRPA